LAQSDQFNYLNVSKPVGIMPVNNHFCDMTPDNIYVHPSSVIDDAVEIGTGTKIWHFSHLMPGCRIGTDCVLGQNVYIGKNVSIGNRVKIQNNVSVYSGVMVEDDVFIGPSVVFTNVINPRSFIERKNEFKNTIVKKGATIGANATILCGIEIGAYAMIGAGAVVTHTVPDFALMTGIPAKQTGWISMDGFKLDFDESGKAVCKSTGRIYKLYNHTIKPDFSY
jgi:UDP-2-acetamido-3-amino-2,3-dideoxy-glucuronate N-acetyltransferase